MIANCFCHWLPEVREGMEHQEINTFLPMAEVIMCSGFFFISGLEEVIHHFLHPHQEPESKLRQKMMKETNYSSHKRSISYPNIEQEKEERETERNAAQIKAAIRTVFVVFALSFHSVVEGKNTQF